MIPKYYVIRKVLCDIQYGSSTMLCCKQIPWVIVLLESFSSGFCRMCYERSKRPQKLSTKRWDIVSVVYAFPTAISCTFVLFTAPQILQNPPRKKYSLQCFEQNYHFISPIRIITFFLNAHIYGLLIYRHREKKGRSVTFTQDAHVSDVVVTLKMPLSSVPGMKPEWKRL